ncbi:MAG: vitamin B12-dependent ribonucleotide reductase, partial [Actinomycetota bacterium]
SGIADALAMAVSFGLQYGVPLDFYVQKFMNMRFEPSGMTDDADIRFTTSIVDYIFRRLALDHLDLATRQQLGILTTDERRERVNGEHGNGNGHGHATAEPNAADAPPATLQITTAPESKPSEASAVQLADAPYCYNCGNKMRPAGSCFVCESCGSTSGCS